MYLEAFICPNQHMPELAFFLPTPHIRNTRAHRAVSHTRPSSTQRERERVWGTSHNRHVYITTKWISSWSTGLDSARSSPDSAYAQVASYATHAQHTSQPCGVMLWALQSDRCPLRTRTGCVYLSPDPLSLFLHERGWHTRLHTEVVHAIFLEN